MGELLEACLLLPFAKIRSPGCPRFVFTDALPGGHGVAYRRLDDGVLPRWARLACRATHTDARRGRGPGLLRSWAGCFGPEWNRNKGHAKKNTEHCT